MHAIRQTVLHQLRQLARPAVTVHAIYSLLGAALLTPLLALIGKALLALNGTTVLTDQDIAWFLLSPLGVVSVVLLTALFIVIAALELTSMLALADETSSGLTRLLRVLSFAALRARRILLFALLLVGRLLLLVLPFVTLAAAVTWWMLSRYDINYYLSAKPAAFWLTAAIGAVLATVLLLLLAKRLLAWSLALPLLLYTDIPVRRAFAASTSMTNGQRRLVITSLAQWLAAVLLLAGVVLGSIGFAAAQSIPSLHGSLPALTAALGGFALLWLLAHLLLGAFNAASFSFAMLALYRHCGGSSETARAADAHRPTFARAAKLTPTRLTVWLLGALLVAIAGGAWLVHTIPASSHAQIIAHRGAAGAAPENTLAAIQHALDAGADWVEIDVQESADGEVIVIHDSDFMKLAAVDLKVWDATRTDLDNINVGSWFAPQFADQRVPTLREVLDLAGDRARVVIELKYYGHDQQLEQRVVDVIEAAGAVDRVAIMSLSYAGIHKLQALRPDWTTGLLTATAIGDLTGRGVDFLAVNAGMANARFIQRAHAAGKQVWVWTVNDAASMARMMSLGVDGLITDEPGLAVDIRRQQAELNRVDRLLLHAAVLFDRPAGQARYRDQSP